MPDVPDVEAPPDPVPPPPEPLVEEATTEVSDVVSQQRCERCDGNKRVRHTFRGACEGYPAEFYFGPRPKRPSALPIEAPSSSSSAGPSNLIVLAPVARTAGEPQGSTITIEMR